MFDRILWWSVSIVGVGVLLATGFMVAVLTTTVSGAAVGTGGVIVFASLMETLRG